MAARISDLFGGAPGALCASKGLTLRILALLEANSITGTAKAVLEFARESPSVSLDIAFFVRGHGAVDNVLTRTLAAENFPFHFIREKGRFDLAVLPRLRQLASELKPDIIWSNSVKSHFLVHLSNIQKGRKWVAFHHGYTATDFKMQLYNQLDRISLPRAQRTITVCRPFAAQLIARGVSPARIRVQHMPIRPFAIDADAVNRLRLEFKLDASKSVILSVGRLSREKGHADLLKAFAAWRKRGHAGAAVLILVGDGPERPRLESLAALLGSSESIFFAGQRDDVAAFYGMADLFILPSYSEGTPNVLLEAMSAHVPVIATRVGGIPEIATDGETALLVKSGNVPDLIDAIEKLLPSASLRQQLSAAAEYVVSAHSPAAYGASLRSIFEEVVAEP